MLARVEIGYDAHQIVAKWDRPTWERVRKSVWGLRLEEWPESNPERPSWYGYGDKTIIDMTTEAVILADLGLPFTVKEFKSTYKAEGKDTLGNTINFNIALPNIGLLSITEVTWMENACTEQLQTKLDEGWRILAVCPPNGTRRPDYILGRSQA
jgi:hypothetical protein